MERLTNFIAVIGGKRRYKAANHQRTTGGNKQDFIDALGLYEDTGLEPEEVTGILNLVKFYQSKLSPVEAQEFGTYGVERLRELIKAEQKRQEADGKLLNPAGEYAAKFAENHGMSIVEAMEQPMVKARFCYFADTGM